MEDHHVDRRQVDAWRHVEPSRTKGPCGLAVFCLSCPRFREASQRRTTLFFLFFSHENTHPGTPTPLLPRLTTSRCTSRFALCALQGRRSAAAKLPVARARGIHPIPSRTRKLSPAARRVLPGPPGGRVRRRRHPQHHPTPESPPPHPAEGSRTFYACSRVILRGTLLG